MAKVLLIGDTSTDRFIYCNCNRLSPEAPVAVSTPIDEHTNAGMAGNVLSNLNTLSNNIEVHSLFPIKSSIKTRYVDKKSNQHLLRVDEDFISEPLFFERAKKWIDDEKYEAVILSDYAKGYLNTDNIGKIADYCASQNIPVFVDTKAILSEWSRNITFVKINNIEYQNQLNANVKTPWSFCQNLIVTQGKNGMVLYGKDGTESYRTKGNEAKVYDVVGAGDTVLAALVVKYLETKDIRQSMDWANKAAQIAVSRKGVVSVNRFDVDQI